MTASKTTGCSRRSRLALAIGAAVALSTAGTALAQDAEGSTAPDAASTAAGATDLDAVIVTANKRVENVREVAAAISVIGEQQLENMGANSLTDYADLVRSEEHTSELQSLMRISYAVFCLIKKNYTTQYQDSHHY